MLLLVATPADTREVTWGVIPPVAIDVVNVAGVGPAASYARASWALLAGVDVAACDTGLGIMRPRLGVAHATLTTEATFEIDRQV